MLVLTSLENRVKGHILNPRNMTASRPSQKLKLFPLHLLPVLLALQLLVLDQLSLAVTITGACKEQCDENRPNGIKQSFKFNCKDVYKSEDDRKKCRASCESCPKEVCDETIEPETGDSWNEPSANVWHCPSTELVDPCLEHCNKYRPKGTREKYTLNCDRDYSEYGERDDCKNQCSNCPSFVCRKNETHLFHCPDEKFEGAECKKQCDKARNYGQLKSFSFKCDEKYDWVSQSDQNECKGACKECPSWVCDNSVDTNSYSCPAIQIEGECLDFCKYQRYGDYGDSFEINCGGSNYECDKGCKKCPFPGLENPLCDPSFNKDFLCPKSEPRDEPLTSQKSYKGTCKTRCETNQGGGFHKYELDCNKRYTSDEEKLDCKKDCDECGNKNCNDDGMIIKCQGIKSELEKEEKEKEEEQKKKGEEQAEQDKELEEQKNLVSKAITEAEENRKHFLIGIVVGLIVLLGIFGGILCYIFNKKKGNRMVQSQFAQPEQQQLLEPQFAQAEQADSGAGSMDELSQQQIDYQQQVPIQQQEPFQEQQLGYQSV